MSNSVPEGWSQSQLGKFIGVQGGNAFKSESFTDAGVPVIRISNIKKDGSVNLEGAVYVNADDSLTRFEIVDGDVLIAMSGATTGKVGRYKSNRSAYLNQRVGRFFSKDDSGVSLNFIHQITSEDNFANSILIDAVGGAQPNISNQQIESITVAFPPLPEQQKIAAILSSVDDVIEKTQAQIDKLKDLKTGMMQELLTKGIGHTEFKDSPVGRIPVEWDYSLGEKFLRLGSGLSPSQVDFCASGDAGFMKVDDYNSPENADCITKTKLSFNPSQNKKVSVYPEGTIVIAKRGAAISKNRVRLFSKPTAVDTNLMTINVNDEYDFGFVKYYLEYFNLDNIADATSVPQINNFHLYELMFPKPSKLEQEKISQSLDSVQKKINSISSKLFSLQNTKKALMQDLLTGTVRVKVD